MVNNKYIHSFLFLFCPIIVIYCQVISNEAKITIDLTIKSKKAESVAGFLHFNDLESLQQNISELKPKYWRFGAKLKEHTPKRKQQVDILLKNNIVPIIVLSDIYDEEHWYKEKGGWIRPSDNPKPFALMVGNLYKELGNGVVFDVWNEPNLKEVWGGTRDEYFKTFKVAHDALRNSPEGKTALITGPSISSYDKEYITAFLEYCSKNSIRLDILNWHDLGNQKDAVQLQKNIIEVRELLKKYPKLGIKNIYIPEIIGLEEQFNPLTAFTYLNSLEKTNVFGGCKACWDNPDIKGENSCWNNSMDGILTVDGKPRASWWLYKYYAESLERRLISKSSKQELISISYLNEKNELSILFGNLGDKNFNNMLIDIKTGKNNKLFQNTSFKLYEIPDSGSAVLDNPKFILKDLVSLNKTGSAITLKNLKGNCLYYLIMSKK